MIQRLLRSPFREWTDADVAPVVDWLSAHPDAPISHRIHDSTDDIPF